MEKLFFSGVAVFFAIGLMVQFYSCTHKNKDVNIDSVVQKPTSSQKIKTKTENYAYKNNSKPNDREKWYWILNQTGKCAVSNGPAEEIKLLKSLRQNYEVVDDVVLDGAPVQVSIIISDGVESGKFVYYRGRDRCNAAVADRLEKDKEEIDRYK